MTLDDVEKGFFGVIVAFQIHEARVVVAVAFGRREAEQGAILHTKNRDNCFEEEFVINVRGLINNDNIRARAAGSLRKEGALVTAHFHIFPPGER